MARKIDDCAGDGFRSVGTHGVSTHTDTIRVDLPGETGDAFLDGRQHIENVGDVQRAALPKCRLLERLANCFHEPNVFFSAVPALHPRAILCVLVSALSLRAPTSLT